MASLMQADADLGGKLDPKIVVELNERSTASATVLFPDDAAATSAAAAMGGTVLFPSIAHFRNLTREQMRALAKEHGALSFTGKNIATLTAQI